MSLPEFPTISPSLTREDVINQIISSIAMEELALSHIMNAEGEKLQYVLGTLNGSPNKQANIDDLLLINKSIKCMLDSIAQNQLILKGKMECAVETLKECGFCKTESTDSTGQCTPCCAMAFSGCPEQCWNSEQPLKWKHSKCTEHGSVCLSDNCEKIKLKKNKCYSISFSVNLCSTDCNNLSISVRTCGCKILDRFIYHAPICDDKIFTASASGIFIETCSCNCPTDLMLILLSPTAVKVSQSSIFITELFTRDKK